MYKFLLKYCAAKIVIATMFMGSIFASTQNGVTTLPGSGAKINGKAYFYNNYASVSPDYVYNAAGSTTSAAGWVSIPGATDRLIKYNITNVTGTAILSLFGKLEGDATEIDIVDIVTTTASSGWISITENIDQLRVGIKGTANVSVTGKFQDIQFSQ